MGGPRLAESRDPGPPGPVRGATLPNTPKHTFLALLGCGGFFFRGVWGPRLAESRDPGPPAPVRGGDPANVPENRPKQTFLAVLGVWGVPSGGLGPQAGRFQGPEASWPCPRGRPRQVPRPGLLGWACPETRKVVLCRLSSNPYRVREAKCLLGALTSRRAAGTGREDPQPDNNPFQLRFCCDTHILCRVRREAESEKAPP